MISWCSSAQEMDWEAGIAHVEAKGKWAFQAPPHFEEKQEVSRHAALNVCHLMEKGLGYIQVNLKLLSSTKILKCLRILFARNPSYLIWKQCCIIWIKAYISYLKSMPCLAYSSWRFCVWCSSIWEGEVRLEGHEMRRREKKLQQIFCMVKPRKQRKRFTKDFQVTLENHSLPSCSRSQYFRNYFISAEKMLKEWLTRAGL